MANSKTTSALERLIAIPLWSGREAFDLAGPKKLMEALGNPQDSIKSVHLTGTNGKGTTSAMIAAMLRCAGLTVGQNSSPHLVDINERILINGYPIEDELFENALQQVFAAVDRDNLISSHFEIITAASFLVFAQERLDWMIIEVGLGGRLDATNLMRAPKVTVVTSIGLDHTHHLGNTHAAIAWEKSHIFRTGVPAFVGPVDSEARETIHQFAEGIGTPVEFFGDAFQLVGENTLASLRGELALPLEERGLLARHQKQNAALAVRVAQELGVSSDQIKQGVLQFRWPGRLEIFSSTNTLGESIEILTDGAHNPDGVRALLDYLDEYSIRRKPRSISIVLSILETKDWKAMLDLLTTSFAERDLEVLLHATTSGHHSAVAPSDIVDYLRGRDVPWDCRVEIDPVIALGKAKTGDSNLVLVTGSLYLLGKLRPHLTVEPFSTIVN